MKPTHQSLENSASGENQTSSFSFPVTRLILFILLVFVIASWVRFHLDMPWVAGFFTLVNILVAVFGMIKNIFSDEDQDSYMSYVRRLLVSCLSPLALLILSLVVLFVCNFFSSVRIYSGGIDDPLNVHLKSIGKGAGSSQALQGANTSLTTIRSTNPFGSSFLLKVDGYQDYPFELYPWVGIRIRIDRELTPTPSLLLRVLKNVGDVSGGEIKLVINQDTVGVYPFDTIYDHGSMMLGYNRAIPTSWEKRWGNELVLKSSRYTDKIRGSLIAGWLSNAYHPLGIQLRENTIVEALFFNHQKIKIASARFKITNEPLQDHLLE